MMNVTADTKILAQFFFCRYTDCRYTDSKGVMAADLQQPYLGSGCVHSVHCGVTAVAALEW